MTSDKILYLLYYSSSFYIPRSPYNLKYNLSYSFKTYSYFSTIQKLITSTSPTHIHKHKNGINRCWNFVFPRLSDTFNNSRTLFVSIFRNTIIAKL